jgi:hypothetical protein
MRLNYFLQHKVFKDLMFRAISPEMAKVAIEKGEAEIFAELFMSAVKYWGQRSPEEAAKMAYEASILDLGTQKAVRCKFVGDLELEPAECSSIVIAVTDTVYYFTVEKTFFGDSCMLCRWDGESHVNYGSVEADDPAFYGDKLAQMIV